MLDEKTASSSESERQRTVTGHGEGAEKTMSMLKKKAIDGRQRC